MLCYLILCYAMLCYVISYHIILYFILFYYILLYIMHMAFEWTKECEIDLIYIFVSGLLRRLT